MIAIFAVDDQPHFLKAAAAVIAATPGFRLVGYATSGTSAADRLCEIGGDIDLVLLDLQLGDIDGPEVARRVREIWPDLAIAYVSMLDPDELPTDLLGDGAIAFVPKAEFGPDWLDRLTKMMSERLR